MTTGLSVAMVSRRVHPAHGPGGLERHVFDLVTELSELGVQVDLYSERPVDPARVAAADEAMPSGVRTHWLAPGWLPVGRRRGTIVIDRVTNYFLWAAEVARRIGVEASPTRRVVHAHGLGGWGLARARLTGRLKMPVVATMQGLEEFRSHLRLKHWAYAPFRRGIRTVARGSSVVVTTDRALQPVVARHLGVPEADQVVLPNAIQPSRCRAAGDAARGRARLAALGLEDATPLFVSVGRLEANKGFTVLAEALGRVQSRLPPTWAWVLVGDGPERGAIERAVAAAGVADRCRLVGRLPDGELHSLLATSAWFVHPTLYEGSSLVTLEAMAHGRPVVASRTGGLPDKVEPGRTGFLVTPGDVADLGEALVSAATTDGTALGEAGRVLCEREFSWPAVAARYVELYESLLTG